MSKMRADSIWNSLAPERRKMFEDWLFEERVSYTEALTRAEKEWGVTGSKTSVHRYYHRVEAERAVNDLQVMMESAESVDATGSKAVGLKASAMKLVAMQLLERMLARGDVWELGVLSRMLTQTEDREIQRSRLALAQRKFEFKASKEVLKHATSLNKITEASQARKDEEVDEAKVVIFGTPPEGYDDPGVTDRYA